MTTSKIAATFGSTRGRAVSSSWVDSPSTFSLRHGLACSDFEQFRASRFERTPESTPPRHAVNPRGRGGLLDLT